MADSPAERREWKALEISALVLMSLASLAGSWSSYQATRWSTVQTRSTAEVGGLRTQANRSEVKALAQQSLDFQMFVRWLEADGRGDAKAMQIYEGQFRPEFRQTFQVWKAARERRMPGRPDTPFDLRSYRLAQAVRVVELDRKADQMAARARNATLMSEAYVQNGVIFALVLFLTGMAQTFRRPRLRTILTVAAALTFLFGLIQGVRLPAA
ncbi:hypothetical protein [Caulobacter sp. 17J80-11]|uniref:hypothetical protein n=1 Tax=Caulobacter sp. 17J80-11 TaxID=2763502 RepID=UPI0016534686|nr:hypothetical protein [Caulobacter sp. 17J80-11]MBC6983299.1 hypothetical protein [Caulobacter sp. 17J80-11]